MALTKTKAKRELDNLKIKLLKLLSPDRGKKTKIDCLKKRISRAEKILGIGETQLLRSTISAVGVDEPNPGMTSGVGYLPLEEPAPEEISTFDASREGPRLRHEIQLNLNEPSGFDEIYKANASKACASCVGHCCRAFSLGPWVDDIPKSIRELRKDLCRTKAELRMIKSGQRKKLIRKNSAFRGLKSTKIIELLGTRIKSCVDEIYGMNFFSTRLKPARNMHFHPVINQDLKRGEKVRIFRCTEFDERTHRCKAHAIRPVLCQRYICNPATAGFVPELVTMTFGQIEIHRKNAKA